MISVFTWVGCWVFMNAHAHMPPHVWEARDGHKRCLPQWTWTSWIQLGWLASELQASSCLLLMSLRLQRHTTDLSSFVGIGETHLGSHVCKAHTLQLTDALGHYISFLKSDLWTFFLALITIGKYLLLLLLLLGIHFPIQKLKENKSNKQKKLND